jgi:aminoglycoside phosphotransferase (APT) family kinase protein
VLGELLARGASAEIFAFGDGSVIKLFLPEYGYIAEVEADRTIAVRAAGLPSAAVRGLETVDDRIGIVMERIDGPTLASEGAESAPQLARLHALVHSDVSTDLPGWRAVVENAKASMSPDERQQLDQRLERVPDGACVYHGDFHPGNVILSQRGPVIVDWPNACCAHPAVDVARTLVLIRYQGASPAESATRRDSRFLLARGYLREYLTSSSVTADEVQRGLPLHAAGLLRAEPDNPHGDELRLLSDGGADADLRDLV